MNNKEEYMIVRREQANEELVKKLLSIKEYLNDDIPQWQQLIAIGGFVADVIKLLKWSEKPVYRTTVNNFTDWDYKDKNVMTCEDIRDEIWIAINYHFNEPYADELNKIWSEWNTDVNKYPEVKTVEDICDVISERMDKVYPGLVEMADKYFRFSKDE